MNTSRALLLLSALLLAGCNQAPGPTTQNPPPVTVAATRVTVTVKIPRAADPAAIAPQYVSSSTTQIRIRIGGTDQTLPVTTGSDHCVTGAEGTTCTFTLSLKVAAGNDLTLTVDALDSKLTVLATASKTVSVNLGQDNPLSITLTGVAAGASYTFTDRAAEVTNGSGTTDLDRGGDYALGVALTDPSGQIIVDPGRPDDLLCSSNAAFVVAATGRGRYTLTAPEPTGQDQTTTLSVVTGDNCGAGTVLTSGSVRVPAETLSLTLDTSSPVAGSSVLATAALRTGRGNPLPISGRSVAFVTTNGTVTTPVTTGAAGTARTTVVTSPAVGSGTVTATSDGVSQSATFTSVAGQPAGVTSTLVFTPDSVKVEATTTLTLTLKDANGNPVTATPVISGPAGATVTATSSSGNVYTYSVTAPSTPGKVTFDARVNGTLVSQADLMVSAYPLVVKDGSTSLSAGARYDFASAAAKTFTVQEDHYSGSFSAASSNTGVATASLSGGTLTVTPVGVGISTITVQDTNGQSFTFDVTVTAVTITIN
ncbi:hypothetical protein E5F05_01260 (plasmid) [Deinococcus metallilatus]|uniref:Invasin domain-containing protein n=1 Tax=Deinococcus metallilatus TaxID=1211322 RepID=A0ABR6MNL7_9DEIO|nr:invasin domain 3-containing protein [Deinococcus metallilatus]MBB5293538.1 hypothetical protein [Deinococcus metallilatus]QBY06613.1 hypothetical protein E5F05_01260 [Deinococcus metallilatus]RXJ17956.1 hypothetical protein ERJ73_00870 [Deinococcus metallilatus]GMA15241.1 hypothetical protein GCM10025871_15720 [Deinococcus metallilatus]